MDYLKKLAVELKGNIKRQSHIDANIGISTRQLLIKDYRKFRIELDEYPTIYSINIKTYSGLGFSINRPDKIFLFTQPNKIDGFPLIVYTERGHFDPQNEAFPKFWQSFSAVLNDFKLTVSEGVFFYSNIVIFALDAERDLAKSLDKIIDFVIENNSVFRKEPKKRINVKNIPENLKPLLPLLKKYSVSDDSERDELVDQMSNSSKTALIDAVDPLMPEIEAYLDSLGHKVFTHEASLISDLAELVAELRNKKI